MPQKVSLKKQEDSIFFFFFFLKFCFFLLKEAYLGGGSARVSQYELRVNPLDELAWRLQILLRFLSFFLCFFFFFD